MSGDSAVVCAGTKRGHAAGRARLTTEGGEDPADEAFERSRGGRLPSIVLTARYRHQSTQLEAALDAIRVPRSGRGRPR